MSEPEQSAAFADLLEVIRSGRYSPQAHLEAVFRRMAEARARREADRDTYERLRGTPAEPWRGTATEFKPLMWFRADTWDAHDLFPDLPVFPDDGYLLDDHYDKYAVRCPGTDFFYALKTLPVGCGLDSPMARTKPGRAFFDAPVRVPVLFKLVPEATQGQEIWMSLTPMEVLTQAAGIAMAAGRVVVGGFGLGWFLKEVAARPEVTEVVVVDECGPLIEWLRPVLEEKFPAVRDKVTDWVAADAYQFVVSDLGARGPRDRTKYLFDIWPGLGDADNDINFVRMEGALGRDRVWGWGHGATKVDATPERIDPRVPLPYPRAYSRKKPCSGCPFTEAGARVAAEKNLVTAEALIGQAHGPFLLPCHQENNYTEERYGNIMALAQCAGVATYRTNVGLKYPASFHTLPADPGVFQTPAALLAAHAGVSLAEAEAALAKTPPEALCETELAKREVRVVGQN